MVLIMGHLFITLYAGNSYILGMHIAVFLLFVLDAKKSFIRDGSYRTAHVTISSIILKFHTGIQRVIQK